MLFTNPQLAPEDLPAYYPSDYSAHAADRPDQRRGGRSGKDPWDRLPEFGGKRLLDVGCGSGAYLLRQREAGWTVFGVEPSAAAVEAARRYGLEVVEGVIPGVALPSQPFDVITMLGVLDHVPDPLVTLRELRQKLCLGGRLIASVPNAASFAAHLFRKFWPGWDLPRHQNHFAPGTLTKMFHRAGFSMVELSWKRRTSRWKRGTDLVTNLLPFPLSWICHHTAYRFRLPSIYAWAGSRGLRSDEIVAVAGR